MLGLHTVHATQQPLPVSGHTAQHSQAHQATFTGLEIAMSNIEKLQKLYLEILDTDYKTEVDSDGDIVFKHPDMGTLFLSLMEDDPEFFCLTFPNFLDSNQVKEEFDVDVDGFFRAINEVNRSCKAANLILNWNDRDQTWHVSARIEAFMAAPDQIPDIQLIKNTFDRNMSAIRSVIHGLIEVLRGDNDNDTTPNDTTMH